jgi:arabinose-5-phosphate isomerase
MHAADAIDGDLGMIRDEDVVIIISKSGETPEIKVLTPLIKIRKNKLVAIVGNTKSYLAAEADYVLDATVPFEACPNNLAPTASTTAQLVMGDALAIALLKCRGFSAEDFAKFHPGGALGKRLYLRVGDVCIKNAIPMVKENDIMTNVIIEITEKLLGATAVMNDNKLIGIITDGDIRRAVEGGESKFFNLEVKDIMTINPKTISAEAKLTDIQTMFRKHKIHSLIVVNSENNLIGIVDYFAIMN